MGTSHRSCIMRKVTCKESTAGGRFESFLNSAQRFGCCSVFSRTFLQL